MKKETGTEGMAKVKELEVCKGGGCTGVCMCAGRVCGGSGGGGGARRQMELF